MAYTASSPSSSNSELADQPAELAPVDEASSGYDQLEALLGYLEPQELAEVRQAYEFAEKAHRGQKRHSGEPYITHPVAVACIASHWKLDAAAIMAALMHDAMEDCGVSKADIEAQFGLQVADLVDGLTKLEKINFHSRQESQAESFRKMLLAMAHDIRVILVKLADRMHNMRTMGSSPRSKWGRISQETMDIYVPIAHRLGLNMVYRELQDLSFQYLQPWRYEVLRKATQRASSRRKDLMAQVEQQIAATLSEYDIQARMVCRNKSLYSIYQRMRSQNLSFAQVTDVYGMQMILENKLDCYTTVGLLHTLYKPIPGRFKDFIAIPKVNGYQSLHTTLNGPANVKIEFQLRTEAMDRIAEAGIVAHWLYRKSPLPDENGNGKDQRWLKSMLDIQSETSDAIEFWNNIRSDLFPDAIYAFTPKGKIMALPRGATVVDFAYAIHSKMGDETVSATINGELLPLSTLLANGDVVNVRTVKGASPNPAWLGFVQTGRARSRIRHHIKQLALGESLALGQKLLLQALHAEGVHELPDWHGDGKPTWNQLLHQTGNKSIEELLVDIGQGLRSASVVAEDLRRLLTDQGLKPDALLLSQARFTAHESLSQGVVLIDGSQTVANKYASCCYPIPGDEVTAYLARGEGLIIHRADCPVVKRLQNKDAERFVHVAWADEPVRDFEVGIVVTVVNGRGVLAKVSAALASCEADITSAHVKATKQQHALDMRFAIMVKNTEHLKRVLSALNHTQTVLRAHRIKAG